MKNTFIMKSTFIWMVSATIGLIGSIVGFFALGDPRDGIMGILDTQLGILQFVLVIVAAINLYVAYAVFNNFDFIELELRRIDRIEAAIAKLESGKEIKEANNSQMDNPIKESIREGEKDSESSNAEKLQEE
tara:strand:- start:280 stop:675 length:396 start_codon:yes stop_codon:yes gene_type:complete